MAIIAGGVIFGNRLEKLKIYFGIPIISMFGLTETTGPIFLTSHNDLRMNLVGGPLPHIEFKIV